MGNRSPLNAELWAMLHGLQVARVRRDRKLVVESDCLVAIKLIHNYLSGMQSSTLVQHIKEPMKDFEEVCFQFIRREGNSVADLLVRSCDAFDVDSRIIDVPSQHVSALVLKDSSCIPLD